MLIRIGLANPFEMNEFGISGDAKYHHSFFKPNRHIPPANPNNCLNVSPAEGMTFEMCKSVQNTRSLTNANGLNKRVCKHIGPDPPVPKLSIIGPKTSGEEWV